MARRRVLHARNNWLPSIASNLLRSEGASGDGTSRDWSPSTTSPKFLTHASKRGGISWGTAQCSRRPCPIHSLVTHQANGSYAACAIWAPRCWRPHAFLIGELKACSPTHRHNPVPIGTYAIHCKRYWHALGGGNYASNIDGVSFGRCSEPYLLSKCKRRTRRRSNHEACRNGRFNDAERTVLCASHPARRHQVLPAVCCGASRLPPLLSLVVVVTTL